MPNPRILGKESRHKGHPEPSGGGVLGCGVVVWRGGQNVWSGGS